MTYESNELNQNLYKPSEEDATVAALTEEHYLLGGTNKELIEGGVLEEIVELAKECNDKKRKGKVLKGILSLVVF